MSVEQPKPHDFRAAIADSIADNLKSYNVAGFCERLGLAPTTGDEDPFRSKRLYVQSKIVDSSVADLVAISHRILEEWDDAALQIMVDSVSARGVNGEVRNIIFASNGPKPKIVLRDAINNVIEVVENSESCLYYDRPVNAGGLTWAELVNWWAGRLNTGNRDVAARILWKRLRESLASEPEEMLFHAFGARYQSTFNQPALLPQVYLHYDPYGRTAGNESSLVRQRMDFLLLLPGRRRVVIEIDGKQHYARPDGTADPSAYASMVAEDRRLRLRGYEVHRFGGQEFVDETTVTATLNDFFDRLIGS